MANFALPHFGEIDIPTGELGENVAGNTFSMYTEDFSGTSLKAILDIGLLDMQPQYLEAVDEEITIVDASSDMLVIDTSSSPKNIKWAI
jgi:predicted amino acid racemase